MTDVKESFAHNLRIFMAHADIKTAEELSAASGVSVYSIRNYLAKASTPSLESLAALGLALGCTPNDLMGWNTDEAAQGWGKRGKARRWARSRSR